MIGVVTSRKIKVGYNKPHFKKIVYPISGQVRWMCFQFKHNWASGLTIQEAYHNFLQGSNHAT